MENNNNRDEIFILDCHNVLVFDTEDENHI